MMKKSLFLLAAIVFLFKISLAQQKDLTYFDHKGEDLVTFLWSKIRYPKAIWDAGGMPFTYVKFKVTEFNEIDSLTITNTDYPQLKTEIAKKIALTNGYWDLRSVKNKWIIIPVDFYIVSDIPKSRTDYKKILEEKAKHHETKYLDEGVIYFPTLTIIGYTKYKYKVN